MSLRKNFKLTAGVMGSLATLPSRRSVMRAVSSELVRFTVVSRQGCLDQLQGPPLALIQVAGQHRQIKDHKQDDYTDAQLPRVN
jgi:hypothetical protein